MPDGVMMLVNEFAPLPVGGAERQAERLSAWLAAHGWTVSVLTRGSQGLPAREQRDGFTVLRIRPRGPHKLGTLTFVLGLLWTLFQRRKEYNILHAHLAFGPAFAAVIAARFLGKRVIVKLGNSGEFGDIRVSQKTLRGRVRLAALRRWADAVITLDDAIQAESLAAGFARRCLRRMNNGIDFELFSSTRSKDESKSALKLDGKVIVLFMGRLSEQKSLPTLLNAFASARQECPALHLLLLGDGPLLPALESQVEALRISENVTFAGSQPDVHPYLEAADIFALPSISEGISNALLEAMSAGLACIATPVGGNAEVLDSGVCGLLVPPRDAPAWAAALAGLGNDSQRRERLGTAARARVRARYDFSVVGGQYGTLYREVNAMTSLRILQIIDGLNIGGAEVLLVDLVRNLREAGYQVRVAYSTPGPMAARLSSMGVPLTRLPRLARVDPFLLLGLMKLMRREKPDIVHTHLFKSDLHGRLAARWTGVPVIVSTAHNNDAWAKRAPLGWLYGQTARLANRVIAVSDEVRDYQIKYTFLPPEKIVTIDNGVNLRRFEEHESMGRAVRAGLGLASDALVVGVIGRLTSQKDHATFLQAAAQIHAELPAARFLVVGDGALREQLISQARSLGLENALIFCGLRSDIPAVLAALDVLVISSRWEGLPVTLLEGMAAARPIVSTAVGGVPGVVTDGESALLVPRSNPSALADATLRVLRDPSLAHKLGAAALERVREKYSLDSMLKKTLTLYDELWRNVAHPRA